MLDRQCLGNILQFMTFFRVFVTFLPIWRKPAHQLAIRKKMDISNGNIARRTNAILQILYVFLIVHNIVNYNTKPYIIRLFTFLMFVV